MSKHDKQIQQLLTIINTKKGELGKKPKITWNTNGIFRFDEQRYFNLNVVKDTDILVDALAFLLQQNEMRSKAASMLGVEHTTFQWNGFTLKDWEDDFTLKTQMIKWYSEQKKLSNLQTKLTGLVSEEAKTEMELEKIKILLK